MRKSSLVVFLLAMCLILGIWTAAAQENKEPIMVMEEKSFDFKEVKEGEVLEHVFKVLNKGDRDLKIIKVQPG